MANRIEEAGRVTDYTFEDWEVAGSVQAALKEVDQAVSAAEILLGQLSRKNMELWRGMEDLSAGLQRAQERFAAAVQGYGAPAGRG